MDAPARRAPSGLSTRPVEAEDHVGDSDVPAAAADLVRAYGIEAAARHATERTLAALDDGNPSVARTWRQVLNAIHRLAASDPDDPSTKRP